MSQFLSAVPRGHLPFILLIYGTDQQRAEMLFFHDLLLYFSAMKQIKYFSDARGNWRQFCLQFYESASPVVHSWLSLFHLTALAHMKDLYFHIVVLFCNLAPDAEDKKLIHRLESLLTVTLKSTNKRWKTSPDLAFWLLLLCDCKQLLTP